MSKDSPEVAARKLKRAVKRGDIDSHTASAEISRLEGLRTTPPSSAGIRSRHSVGSGYTASNRASDDGDVVDTVAGIAVDAVVNMATGSTPGEALAEATAESVLETVFGDE